MVEEHCQEHCILEKAQEIETQLATEEFGPTHREPLSKLDDVYIQGMIHAERKCYKLHMHPHGWSPELTCLMMEI